MDVLKVLYVGIEKPVEFILHTPNYQKLGAAVEEEAVCDLRVKPYNPFLNNNCLQR